MKLSHLFLITILNMAGGYGLSGQPADSGNSAPQRYFKPCFDRVQVTRDIAFGKVINHEGKSEELLLDIYAPENNLQLQRRLIVWFHGGGFKPGNDKTQAYIVTLCKAFAQRGYVCISPNYRLRKDPASDLAGTLDDALDDVTLALKWIQKNDKKYHIDSRCIIVGGGSAGGILLSNFCFRNGKANNKWNVAAFINLWGSPGDKLLTDDIDRQDPPTIIIHGTNDTVVPFQNSVHLSSSLVKAGVYCELHALPGASHTPTDRMEEIVTLINDFLNRPEIKAKTR